jgi:hypothetical protein
MAFSTTHRLENSWTSFFEQHHLQAESNKELRDLSSLCDPTDDVAEFISSLSNNSDLLLVGVASNRHDIIVLHHFTDLGSSRLSPEPCAVALSGNGDVATPLAIDCEASAKAFSLSVPSWDTLFQASDSASSFKAAASSSDTVFSSAGLIMVPQALGVPMMKSPSKNAADIGVVVAAAMVHHEASAQDDVDADSFMAHCRYVLLFCKAVSEGKVHPTVCSPSEAPQVIAWSASLHARHIMPRTVPSSTGTGGPSDATMQQVSATMSNMAVTMATQHDFVVTQSEKKTPGFSKLGSHAQKLILFASSPDPDTQALAPVPDYATFLSIKTIGGAREHLKNELKAAHGVDLIPSTALTAALSTGVFLWDQPDLPSHVSFFFCGDTEHLGSTSEESLQLHLKAEGAGLSSSEIEKLVKQTSHSPCEFHRAHDQMGNFHSVFAFATGADGAIALCIKAQVTHMTLHKRTYMQLQIQDRNFLSKVGFAVDIAIQTFLRSCRHATTLDDVAFDALDLSEMHGRILGFSFNIMLLDVLKPKSQKRSHPDAQDPPTSGAPRREQDRKKASVSVKNGRQRVDFKLKPGEKYSDFAAHRSHCPKCASNQEACMKYNIKGFCRQGCPYKHDLEGAEVQAFATFIKSARNGDF